MEISENMTALTKNTIKKSAVRIITTEEIKDATEVRQTTLYILRWVE